MLFHHDSRGYEVAASDAAKHARSLMEAKIEAGQESATGVIAHVHENIPQDAIVKGRALSFGMVQDGPGIRMSWGKDIHGIHRHALTQLAGRAGVPSAYIQDLVNSNDGWQRRLAADILKRHYSEGHAATGNLVRVVQGDVRGFLSDRYRRLDSRPLLDAFAGACHKIGALPVEGTVTDLRVAVKAFLPIVFEPVPNEVMCLGVEWGNSDFGAAKHTVRAFIWRLWCTNFGTMEDSLSQVHLGRQMSDDIELSKRTHRLDTEASVSALQDIVAGALAPAKVNNLLEIIRQADAAKVEWRSVKSLLARKLLKGELKAVEEAFEGDDVINLPQVKSMWRVSNAVSWIAGKAKDEDRRLELQRLAGEMVNGRADAA